VNSKNAYAKQPPEAAVKLLSFNPKQIANGLKQKSTSDYTDSIDWFFLNRSNKLSKS
jgi:hypothetical protein